MPLLSLPNVQYTALAIPPFFDAVNMVWVADCLQEFCHVCYLPYITILHFERCIPTDISMQVYAIFVHIEEGTAIIRVLLCCSKLLAVSVNSTYMYSKYAVQKIYIIVLIAEVEMLCNPLSHTYCYIHSKWQLHIKPFEVLRGYS